VGADTGSRGLQAPRLVALTTWNIAIFDNSQIDRTCLGRINPTSMLFDSTQDKRHSTQWCASSCTSSASKNARYASAPAAGSPCAVGASATAARVGSVASYAASSTARSGRVGAEGSAGALKSLTAPTWASFACFYHQRVNRIGNRVRMDRVTHSGRSFVQLELLQIQVLYEV
jgi:hypothetical protein